MLEGDGSKAKALFWRGLAHAAMGQLALAESDLSAALRVSPHNEDVLAALKGVRGQLDASASASIREELQRMQSLRELREMCEGKGLDCS